MPLRLDWGLFQQAVKAANYPKAFTGHFRHVVPPKESLGRTFPSILL
jgi:hypothetical protein